VFDDEWFRTLGEQSSYERREEVNERIAKHMVLRSTDDWSAMFAAAKVWFAPVNTYADIVDDPQVLHNKTFVQFDHPRAGTVTLLGHPLVYDGQRPGVRCLPPALGAANREVLSELGLAADDVERLQAKVMTQ
jgi:crotonobetainyl-CoA:carnitine CoA-transferase CaiB-like acyl-CoA transferase